MKQVAVAVMMVVGIVGVITITKMGTTSPDEPSALVDDSVARGTSWKAACPTMDGGTDASLFLNVDGGAAIGTDSTDIIIGSDSSTCVRVGLDSTVDQNHGQRVGTGCRDGASYPMHTKTARCQSEGARVVVDVTGARP